MLNAILDFLGILPKAFSTIDNITNAIANEKIAAIGATTQQVQIASTERVASLEAQRDAFIAETNRSKVPIYVQACLASAVVVTIWKLLVWDKVIGSIVGCSGRTEPGTCISFTTDGIDLNLWWVMIAVVGFFTLHSFRDKL